MNSFGYILGTILTDGSIFFTQWKRGNYTVKEGRIKLECKDEAYCKRFAGALSDYFKRDVKYKPFVRSNFKTSTLKSSKPDYEFHGFLTQVKAVNHIQFFKDEMEKVMCGKLDYPPEVLESMLTAIVDADGYITKSGIINITQKEPQWILDILNTMNIPYNLLNSPSQKVSHIILNKSYSQKIETYKHTP